MAKPSRRSFAWTLLLAGASLLAGERGGRAADGDANARDANPGDANSTHVNFAQLVDVFVPPPPRDGLSRAQAAAIERAIADFERRHPRRSAAKLDVPQRFHFFPQAGILGRDLFLNNYVDLDPSRTLIRDWDCSDYTYDGHQGHDSLIRSFREQAVGVPVFAVLPGRVVDAHDGESDMNTDLVESARANYVVLDHGGGLVTMYLHFKTGSVAVARDQAVAAGTQLGLTGSSGFSNWPHLHLETRQGNQPVEPSAGPCRGGDSLWTEQAPVVRDPYVAGFYLSPGPLQFLDRARWLRDLAPRAGSFVKGRQTIGLRIDFRNPPAFADYRLRVLDPRRRVAHEFAGSVGGGGHLGSLLFNVELDLQTLGTWHGVLDSAELPTIDAPFKVVASSRQVRNRPPAKVKATLSPSSPVDGEVVTCTVNAPAVKDPDYDVVGYRYEWRVGSQVVRTVTS
ncbi:MAG TPA: M23 family metallopeptidase, partial [Thermoanaerobaculia bacterium]|nr:M23 family metallopeptidase [Thermoanaerobaculia bacterium]